MPTDRNKTITMENLKVELDNYLKPYLIGKKGQPKQQILDGAYVIVDKYLSGSVPKQSDRDAKAGVTRFVPRKKAPGPKQPSSNHTVFMPEPDPDSPFG
jgi:hypothetical protein